MFRRIAASLIIVTLTLTSSVPRSFAAQAIVLSDQELDSVYAAGFNISFFQSPASINPFATAFNNAKGSSSSNVSNNSNNQTTQSNNPNVQILSVQPVTPKNSNVSQNQSSQSQSPESTAAILNPIQTQNETPIATGNANIQTSNNTSTSNDATVNDVQNSFQPGLGESASSLLSSNTTTQDSGLTNVPQNLLTPPNSSSPEQSAANNSSVADNTPIASATNTPTDNPTPTDNTNTNTLSNPLNTNNTQTNSPASLSSNNSLPNVQQIDVIANLTPGGVDVAVGIPANPTDNLPISDAPGANTPDISSFNAVPIGGGDVNIVDVGDQAQTFLSALVNVNSAGGNNFVQLNIVVFTGNNNTVTNNNQITADLSNINNFFLQK